MRFRFRRVLHRPPGPAVIVMVIILAAVITPAIYAYFRYGGSTLSAILSVGAILVATYVTLVAFAALAIVYTARIHDSPESAWLILGLAAVAFTGEWMFDALRSALSLVFDSPLARLNSLLVWSLVISFRIVVVLAVGVEILHHRQLVPRISAARRRGGCGVASVPLRTARRPRR